MNRRMYSIDKYSMIDRLWIFNLCVVFGDSSYFAGNKSFSTILGPDEEAYKMKNSFVTFSNAYSCSSMIFGQVSFCVNSFVIVFHT